MPGCVPRTGGFLSEVDEYIQSISKQVTVSLHGQELNPESYAICKADMLIKGQDAASIRLGNTLSDDQLAGKHFDFMLSNPPFGVEWKKVTSYVYVRSLHLPTIQQFTYVATELFRAQMAIFDIARAH